MAFLNITELPVVQGVDCQNIMFILLYPCIQLVYNRTEFPDFVRPLKPPAPLPYFFADNPLISTVLSVYFPTFMTENPHGRGCGFKSRHGIIPPSPTNSLFFSFHFLLHNNTVLSSMSFFSSAPRCSSLIFLSRANFAFSGILRRYNVYIICTTGNRNPQR